MNRSDLMHTNELTQDAAVSSWSSDFNKIEVIGSFPNQTFIDAGCGLGKSYKNEITYKVVEVRYQRKPRGRWQTGYIGYDEVKEAI